MKRGLSCHVSPPSMLYSAPDISASVMVEMVRSAELFTGLEGVKSVDISYTGTLPNGNAYELPAPPVNAGSYTVRLALTAEDAYTLNPAPAGPWEARFPPGAGPCRRGPSRRRRTPGRRTG